MFRVSQLMAILNGAAGPAAPPRGPVRPVVIWNLIRRCNLTCRHCYSTSADRDFAGELDTAEAEAVMDDLHAYGVRALILSGGEPLMRPDILALSRRAKEMGFMTALSTNGTLIDAPLAKRLAAVGYDYVGISLDGLGATHDAFRRREGAFEAALRGIRLCRDAGLKVGIRFTLTEENAADLPGLLDLMEREGVHKFYLSHLNYAGRGNRNRRRDALHRTTRAAMALLFERAWEAAREGAPREYVTGNNDADGAFLWLWARERLGPEAAARLEGALAAWGGNQTGVAIANIDNLGNVHPDSFWWHHTLGNVRERPFSAIWEEPRDALMEGLRRRPRPVRGRCARCRFLAWCNGNTRLRALQLTGDPWAEDPGCYLTEAEIAAAGEADAARAAG
ncbi:MAG TPA: heme d1 biosynthesis radical SAM protein NirJ [Chromatiales bacterium]|nr:heme d1 biosynthesis radical SAM protein NirJ [Chromatiales bacterium]